MTDEQTFEGEPDALPVLPSSIRAAVVSELSSFESFVEGLGVEDTAKPSTIKGWSNLDVIAHVQLALSLYTRVLAAAASGWTGGAVGKAVGSVTKTVLPAAAPAINAINSMLPHVMTGTLEPEAVQGQLVGSSRSLRARLEKLQSVDYTKPIYYRGAPWPVSFFMAAMLNEIAIHRWDIESTLVGDAHLSDAARSVLPWFYWSGTSIMFRPPAGTAGTVAMALVDPTTDLSWVIDAGGTISTLRGIEPNTDATIRGENGTVILALAGRISPEDAVRTTSVTVEGDEVLGNRFLSSWKIL